MEYWSTEVVEYCKSMAGHLLVIKMIRSYRSDLDLRRGAGCLPSGA